MERFFAVNLSLFLPVALIVLCLVVSAAARCFGHLFRKARHLFTTTPGRPLTSLGAPAGGT